MRRVSLSSRNYLASALARTASTASAHNLPQRAILAFQAQLSGLDPGDVEQVIDQCEQNATVVANRVEIAGDLGGTLPAVGVFIEKFGKAEDGRQRRAELVADLGEKLTLGLAGLLGGLLAPGA